ncbi:hypothetical protein DUNSADRAFT_17024 [Dunaliella salina]|uniref:Uncharacterized protein n=1 Tax=Dunaliella salina TaxID=3046 RepID=A0ABQ7G2I4_DUNSA|nr:hypothetical protein DUNSADRAFT_17024 [Dunaliella salina]|eukprot:KAF5828807.1 hypothetical protein DUNSADRAFT_17024 [Dunaliella salina]
MTGQAHLDYTLCLLLSVHNSQHPDAVQTAFQVGGLGLGVAYAASGYLIDSVDAFKGHAAGGATSLVLLGVMGSRFAKTRKAMPAGILTGVGGLASVFHGMKMREWA